MGEKMQQDRRQFIACSLISAGALSFPVKAQENSEKAAEAKMVGLRGRVVCLTEELEKRYQILPECQSRGHVYSLKTEDGKIHPFLPTDTAAAIWMDKRFRERELQVTARIFPESSFLEVVNLQSWRDGKLHDLYYYCDVCAISTHKPGPCECCQDPYQFRETPAEIK
jgi:hypothetical protein